MRCCTPRRARLSLLLSLLLLGLLAAAPAAAQERTGRIEGRIYDDEGMPMPGARVTVSSPTQIGGPRTVVTRDDGSFRFLGLIPGEFKLRVGKAGWITVIRKGIRVNVNKTVTLDILLDRAPSAPPPRPEEPGTGEPGTTDEPPKPGEPKAPPDEPAEGGAPRGETYVITADRPVVDVTKATTGESLSDEYVESVPLLSRSYQGVAGMTSSVTQRRNPKGSGGGNPTVSGGAYFQNTYTVDGMETTDPVTHTFSTNFNFDAMADVNIMTGGMGPEHSDTVGGVINMVTKSGSNQLELDSSIYYQDDALTIKRLDEEGSTFRNLDFNLNIGGPLVRDRLWYYTSFELNQSTSTIPPDPNAVLADHPSREYLGGKFFGKLTWQPHARHKLMVWAQTSPAGIKNTQQLITVEPDAESHQNQYNVLATAAWEWLATDDVFVKTQLGFGWNGLRIHPESGVRDVWQIQDRGTGVTQRNYSRFVEDDRYRISLNSSATYFADVGGKHEIKGGLRFQHIWNPTEESYTGDRIERTRFGQPLSLTRYFLEFDDRSTCDPLDDQYDRQRCVQGTLRTRVSGNKLIAFLQDAWKPPGFERLTVIPGVAFHFGDTKNPDGAKVTDFTAATAHLNFALDLFDDGKTVIRGGYNQYVDIGFLSLARFIGKDFVEWSCDWDPSTQTYSRNCRKGGQIRTVGRPQGPSYDENGDVIESSKFNPDALTVPRVHELTFGAEREWLPGFSTGVDVKWRSFDNQWEDLETNVVWNEVGDNSLGFKNGKSEFIFDLETPEEAYRRYLALTLFARKFVGNWQVMASYTWSRSEGTVSEGFATVFLDRARQVDFFDGYLPDDRRHVVKATGWYRMPWDLTIGGSVWVGTGTPYDKLYFNSFFNDYNDRRAPRGYDPGDLSTPEDDTELRTPTRLAFDLKITYRLRALTEILFGAPQNMELIGEIFNVVNMRTATRFEDRNLPAGASTQWNDILDRQNPFRVRFGLRYRY